MKTFLAIYMGTEAAIERWRNLGEAERKHVIVRAESFDAAAAADVTDINAPAAL